MATIQWLTGVSGDWSQGSDWAGGVAPGAGDDAVIDASGSYTVTISTAISANSLTLDDAQAVVTETATGSLTLTGALTLTAGTFQAGTGPTTLGALDQSGGTLSGAGTITVTGGASFTGGYDVETGTGTTVLRGSSSITGYVALDGGRVLENQGTLTWSSGYIYLGYNPSGSVGGATLQNDAGAVFDIDTNGYEILANTGTVSFVNAGTVAETAGTGTTIAVPLTNTGTVEVETGTLELTGGGSSSASALSVAAGATLEFGGGSFTLTSGTIGGAGTVALANVTSTATLALGSQNVTTLPSFSQSSGTLSGTGTLTLAGGAAFSGGYDAETGSGTTVLQGLSSITGYVTLDGGRVLENQGTLTWSSGYIYLGYNPSGTSLGGATVQNDAGAVFDIDTNGYEILDNTGTVSFVNAGTVAETAGTRHDDRRAVNQHRDGGGRDRDPGADRRRVVERIGVERVGGGDPGVCRRHFHADQRHDRRGRDGGAEQQRDPGAGLAECDDAAELQPVQRHIVGHRHIDAGRRGRLQRRVRCRDRFRDDGAAGFVVDHRVCDIGRRPGAGEPGHADLEQRLHLSRLQPVGHQPGRGDGAERRRCGLRHRHQRLPDRRRERDGVVCQCRDGGGDGGERHDDRRAVDQHRDG